MNKINFSQIVRLKSKAPLSKVVCVTCFNIQSMMESLGSNFQIIMQFFESSCNLDFPQLIKINNPADRHNNFSLGFFEEKYNIFIENLIERSEYKTDIEKNVRLRTLDFDKILKKDRLQHVNLNLSNFKTLLKLRFFGTNSLKIHKEHVKHRIHKFGAIYHFKYLQNWNKNFKKIVYPNNLTELTIWSDASTSFSLSKQVVSKCSAKNEYNMLSCVVRFFVEVNSDASKASSFELKNYQNRRSESNNYDIHEVECLYISDHNIKLSSAAILACHAELFEWLSPCNTSIRLIEDNCRGDNKNHYRYYEISRNKKFDNFRNRLTIVTSVDGHSNGRADNAHWSNRYSFDKLLEKKISQNKNFNAPNNAKDLVDFLNKYNKPRNAYNPQNPTRVKLRRYINITQNMISQFENRENLFLSSKGYSTNMKDISHAHMFKFDRRNIELYYDFTSKEPYLTYTTI